MPNINQVPPRKNGVVVRNFGQLHNASSVGETELKRLTDRITRMEERRMNDPTKTVGLYISQSPKMLSSPEPFMDEAGKVKEVHDLCQKIRLAIPDAIHSSSLKPDQVPTTYTCRMTATLILDLITKCPLKTLIEQLQELLDRKDNTFETKKLEAFFNKSEEAKGPSPFEDLSQLLPSPRRCTSAPLHGDETFPNSDKPIPAIQKLLDAFEANNLEENRDEKTEESSDKLESVFDESDEEEEWSMEYFSQKILDVCKPNWISPCYEESLQKIEKIKREDFGNPLRMVKNITATIPLGPFQMDVLENILEEYNIHH